MHPAGTAGRGGQQQMGRHPRGVRRWQAGAGRRARAQAPRPVRTVRGGGRHKHHSLKLHVALRLEVGVCQGRLPVPLGQRLQEGTAGQATQAGS